MPPEFPDPACIEAWILFEVNLRILLEYGYGPKQDPLIPWITRIRIFPAKD